MKKKNATEVKRVFMRAPLTEKLGDLPAVSPFSLKKPCKIQTFFYPAPLGSARNRRDSSLMKTSLNHLERIHASQNDECFPTLKHIGKLLQTPSSPSFSPSRLLHGLRIGEGSRLVVAVALSLTSALSQLPRADAQCGQTAAQPVTVDNETNLPNSRQLVNGANTTVDTSSPGQIKVNVPTSGVTAGSYTKANITVNSAGQVTAAVNGSGTSTPATIRTGSWVSRPTTSSGTTGIYLPTDSNIEVIDNATSLEYRAFGYKVLPPVVSDFTTYDPGSASLISTDSTHGGVIFTVQNPSGGHRCEFLKSIGNPSNYTATIALEPLLFNGNYSLTGICIQQASTGQSIDFDFAYTSGWSYAAYHRNPDTTYNGTVFNSGDYPLPYTAPMRFFRIVNDGTNRSYMVSNDGNSWVTLASEPSGTFITEDHWGVVLGTEGNTSNSTTAHVLHVKDGTP